MESCMEQKRKGSIGLEGIAKQAKEAAKREEEEWSLEQEKKKKDQ